MRSSLEGSSYVDKDGIRREQHNLLNDPTSNFFFFQAEDGIRDYKVTGVTCALPIYTVELSFPSGRTAEEVVVRDAASLAWVINLGCIDLNPHPVRAEDLDHPDELRIDLDPMPA